MAMAGGDLIQRLAGRNHQNIHRLQPQPARMQARRHQAAHMIEALQQLDIAFQAVDKGAVEHMPADLRQARRPCARRPWQFNGRRPAALGIATYAHHQHPCCP